MTRGQRGEADLPPGSGRDLVDLFRRLLQARPLTNGEIVVKTGLSSRGHVNDVLTGRKLPSPATAAKIADALGGSRDEILSARSLAEQQGDLNRYHRARDTAPSAAQPGADVDNVRTVARPREPTSTGIDGLPAPIERPTSSTGPVTQSGDGTNAANTGVIHGDFSVGGAPP